MASPDAPDEDLEPGTWTKSLLSRHAIGKLTRLFFQQKVVHMNSQLHTHGPRDAQQLETRSRVTYCALIWSGLLRAEGRPAVRF